MAKKYSSWMIGIAIVLFFGALWYWNRTNVIHVSRVYIVEPAGDASAVMYLTVDNRQIGVLGEGKLPGCLTDTLIAVSTDVAREAELHVSKSEGSAGSSGTAPMGASAMDSPSAMGMSSSMPEMPGMSMMFPVRAVPIAGCTTTRFAPGGYHVMLMGTKVLRRGEIADVAFKFAYGSEIHAQAQVIGYADVDALVRGAQ